MIRQDGLNEVEAGLIVGDEYPRIKGSVHDCASVCWRSAGPLERSAWFPSSCGRITRCES
jgi:hypothetical protein